VYENPGVGDHGPPARRFDSSQLLKYGMQTQSRGSGCAADKIHSFCFHLVCP